MSKTSILKRGCVIEKPFNQDEFYRKTLHSGLLCDDRDCDICYPPVKCHYVEAQYPVDSAGNNKIWVCYCKTTACTNIHF